jgi:hypothetical protein
MYGLDLFFYTNLPRTDFSSIFYKKHSKIEQFGLLPIIAPSTLKKKNKAKFSRIINHIGHKNIIRVRKKKSKEVNY